MVFFLIVVFVIDGRVTVVVVAASAVAVDFAAEIVAQFFELLFFWLQNGPTHTQVPLPTHIFQDWASHVVQLTNICMICFPYGISCIWCLF